MSPKRPAVPEPVSIVMPSYNEVESIETVVAVFMEVVMRHLPQGSEFIIEDSGSTDGTKEILQDMVSRHQGLRVVFKPKREGIPAALQSLIRAAKCPWIFMVDSDGQSLAPEFWKLVPSMKDHDLILGRRTVRHDPLYRRWGSQLFSRFCGLIYGFKLKDVNAAFRLGRREPLLRCANLYGHMTNAFYAESTIWTHAMGCRICEVEVKFGPRLFGTSHAFPHGTIIRQFVRSFWEVWQMRKETARVKTLVPVQDVAAR